MTLPERLAFYSHDDGSGCRVWHGSTDGRMGYGKLTWGGRYQFAHRLSWEDANGRTVPVGLVVKHACDNPRCINPEHLSIGTQAENVAEQFARGRARRMRGSAHVLSRLSPEDIRAIRTRAAAGERQADLGREFGLSQPGVSRIILRRSYKDVA